MLAITVRRLHSQAGGNFLSIFREFDLTLDHMQNDIDALEKEKQELKQRLTQLSKKTLYESLGGRPGASPIAAAVVGGGKVFFFTFGTQAGGKCLRF